MMIEKIISDILIYIIIIGGFTVGVINLIDIIKQPKMHRRFTDLAFAKWCYAFLGFYWCVVYSVLQFSNFVDKFVFTSTYIRPSITLLIILLLLGKQKPVYLPDMIKKLLKRIQCKRRKKYG